MNFKSIAVEGPIGVGKTSLVDFLAREPEHFQTAIGRVDGGAVAMWHGDAGYEAGEPGRPGARHRLWMLEDGWRYERSDA